MIGVFGDGGYYNISDAYTWGGPTHEGRLEIRYLRLEMQKLMEKNNIINKFKKKRKKKKYYEHLYECARAV